MPDDTTTTHRDVFTGVRPLLTHLIYAAAGAWVAATVLTARLPAPTTVGSPQPDTGLVGWNAAAAAVVVVLVTAAKRLRAAKHAADKGDPWPSVCILISVGVACWLCAQAPAPPSLMWSHQPTAGLLDLCYGTVTGMFLLLYAAAIIVLGAAAPLGIYAAGRWLSSPADPPRWGTLTPWQLLLIGWRLLLQERRLGLRRGHHTPLPDAPGAAPRLTDGESKDRTVIELTPATVVLETHDGRQIPYPRPVVGRATFNVSSGPGVSWAGFHCTDLARVSPVLATLLRRPGSVDTPTRSDPPQRPIRLSVALERGIPSDPLPLSGFRHSSHGIGCPTRSNIQSQSHKPSSLIRITSTYGFRRSGPKFDAARREPTHEFL